MVYKDVAEKKVAGVTPLFIGCFSLSLQTSITPKVARQVQPLQS